MKIWRGVLGICLLFSCMFTIGFPSQVQAADLAKQVAVQSGQQTHRNIANLSENDIRLISNAVYGESRGEPFIGQVAVAAVILNRIHSPLFPHSVAAVIFQPGAFTAVSDGQIYLTPNKKARQAVMDALHGIDPTGGCLYYFNPRTATSKWIWSRPQVKKIGQHIFCR